MHNASKFGKRKQTGKEQVGCGSQEDSRSRGLEDALKIKRLGLQLDCHVVSAPPRMRARVEMAGRTVPTS